MAPLGLVAFVYLMVIHQFAAAIWCFISALLISSCLHLNMLLFRTKLDDWYDPYAMENLKMLSLFACSITTVASGVHIAIAVKHRESFEVQSNYVSAIASLTALFFGFWFYGLARRYKRYIEQCIPLLPPADRRPWRTF